jgi:signal peptidase I
VPAALWPTTPRTGARQLQAMRRHPLKKLLAVTLGLIVLGSLWFYFAPAPLGGSTTYVVTHGVSMEPHFHTGDLAIVRSQSSYHVGEVVAYHNKELHTIVLHRIIGRDGNRYIFKGDNNDFIDFEHPAASQLIGALWLHIPGAGATLQSIRSPALVGILVGAGLLLSMGGVFVRRRRLRRRQRRAGQSHEHGHIHSPMPAGDSVTMILAFGLIALLPFVMLAVLAFTRPSTKLHAVPVPYKQSGRFSYSANATPGPAYPADRAVTGDPLFTRVLNEVNLRFGYLFASAAKHSLSGKASLSATLTSTSGWNTTFPLGSTTYFRGDHGGVSATLNLSSLQALIQSVEKTTKVSGSYTLAIVPHVSVTGNLDHLPLSTTFSPLLEFSVSELEVKPTLGGGASSATTALSTATAFTPSASSSVPSKGYQPLFLSFKLARLSVATARSIALIGIAIVIASLVAMLALLRLRVLPRDEATSIRARYGHMIIPVGHITQPSATSVIDVADMEALVHVAEHYDRSILHETGAGGEAFWVSDESGQFRYAIGAPALIADQPAVASESEQSTYTVSAPASIAAQQVAAAGSAQPDYTFSSPELNMHQPVAEPRTLEFPASEVYAEELELGGVISAFETQPSPEPVAPEPVVHGGWPTPEPAAHNGWAAAPEPVIHERWTARDLADALTQDNLSWPGEDEAADAERTRAGAFARIAGLN